VNSEAIAAVVAAAGLGVLLVVRDPAVRRAAAGVWVAGTVVLAIRLLHSSIDRAGTIASGHPVVVVPATVVAIACLVAAAAAFHRWPWGFAVACVLAAPVRIPVHFGAQDAKLLLPLYGVLAAGALASLYDIARAR
jgi:hypothetical protein